MGGLSTGRRVAEHKQGEWVIDQVETLAVSTRTMLTRGFPALSMAPGSGHRRIDDDVQAERPLGSTAAARRTWPITEAETQTVGDATRIRVPRTDPIAAPCTLGEAVAKARLPSPRLPDPRAQVVDVHQLLVGRQRRVLWEGVCVDVLWAVWVGDEQ